MALLCACSLDSSPQGDSAAARARAIAKARIDASAQQAVEQLRDASASARDASLERDASAQHDAAGLERDAGARDAGLERDASAQPDAGLEQRDASARDADVDAQLEGDASTLNACGGSTPLAHKPGDPCMPVDGCGTASGAAKWKCGGGYLACACPF